MKIGVFDSGLGGLFLMKPVVAALPQYDYVYLGDTKNLPYGDKSQEDVYRFTKRALDFLFSHDCAIVFLFCNTASARALRRLQHEGYRALGIIIPTAEEAHGKRIGVLATQSTVDSGTYVSEIKKLLPDAEVFQQAAPKLVPMIESGKIYKKTVDEYVKPLSQHNIDTLILGCTHYGVLKSLMPKHIQLICQEDIIAPKVADYLKRHPEIETKLSRSGRREYFVTAHHPGLENFGDFDGSRFSLVVL
ncbi:MAG: glutamate racemase [Patescibacteria group bacterium]